MTKDTKDPKAPCTDTADEPKRRTRRAAKNTNELNDTTQETMGADKVADTKTKLSKKTTRTKHSSQKPKLVTKEAYLEFVEQDNGALVLREIGSDESLISIDFADKIKDILGRENIQHIGQHMIQAAIASFMQRQMSQWHAHVHEETPEHFS